jgi:excisionase family DNA binding protein
MNTPATTFLQTTLFGAPEPHGSYSRDTNRRCADLPVACERELLWPAGLVEAMAAQGVDQADAVALLERLYGDIPRRTRLRVDEICRRLRCDNNMVYRHIESGELPAGNVGTGDQRPEWRVYRAGLVMFLAMREFGPVVSRTDCRREDAELISKAVARVRRGMN